MSRIALMTLPLGLLSACLATSGEPIGRYEHPRTALRLVDLQRDFLEEDGRMPVGRAQVEPMIAGVKDLVSEARARGLPVVADSDEAAKAEALEGLAERGVRVVGSGADVEW